MRKVVASEIVSLDGVVESPEEWHSPYFSDEGDGRDRAGPVRLGGDRCPGGPPRFLELSLHRDRRLMHTMATRTKTENDATEIRTRLPLGVSLGGCLVAQGAGRTA